MVTSLYSASWAPLQWMPCLNKWLWRDSLRGLRNPQPILQVHRYPDSTLSPWIGGVCGGGILILDRVPTTFKSHAAQNAWLAFSSDMPCSCVRYFARSLSVKQMPRTLQMRNLHWLKDLTYGGGFFPWDLLGSGLSRVLGETAVRPLGLAAEIL